MQTYDLPRFQVVHADLYRTSGAAELTELGFDDLPEDAVTLLEWPDRAGSWLPPDRLDIAITLAPKLKVEFRHARLTGHGSFAPRVERMGAIRGFLADSGLSEAQRHWMPGDASTRAYERLILGDRHLILMNWPRRPDGPPLRVRPQLQRDRASGRRRGAVRGHGQGVARIRAAGARDPSRRSRARPAGDRGSGRGARGRGRAAGPDRGTLRGRGRRALGAARAAASRSAAGRAASGISHSAFRPGGVPDRGRALARLVSAAPERAGLGPAAPGVPRRMGRGAGAGPRGAADLGAARLSFAQSVVAAQSQGPGAARHPGFPGRRDGAGRLRPGVAPARCPRRCDGGNRARFAQPLSAPAAAPPSPISTAGSSSGAT